MVALCLSDTVPEFRSHAFFFFLKKKKTEIISLMYLQAILLFEGIKVPLTVT